MDMDPQFALITPPLDVRATLPVELLPGYFMRRATGNEVERIRESTKPWGWIVPFTHRFEHRLVTSSTGGTTVSSPQRLPPVDWRYFVVEVRERSEPEPASGGFQAIEDAARLTGVELRCPMWFPVGGGVVFGDLRADPPREALAPKDAPVFTDEDAAQIRSVNRQIRALGTTPEHADVLRSLDLFAQLDHVDRRHGLYVLGLFAVIESLLTHSPHGEYDSLGHQIRTKLALLSDRFDQPVDYAPFGGAGFDAVWKKLYECRSRIAHGGEFDFAKSLKALGSLGTVGEFLRAVTKRLLRQALAEPALLIRLRAC